MKLRHTLLTTLIFLTTSQTALAFCKLNIRGDSICIGEKALHQMEVKGETSEGSYYRTVKVEDMDYPKVVVKEGKDSKTVSIDSLVGAQDCTSSDHVCERDKVEIVPNCVDTKKSKFKVKKVYNNEMLEVKSQAIPLLEKSETLIVPAECVDAI